MPLNGSLEKGSVYISLDARPIPGEYHWGLVFVDSEVDTKPILRHVTNRDGPWVYEEKVADVYNSLSLVALVRLSGFESHSSVMEVIRTIPVDGKPSLRTEKPFNCLTWVEDVLVALHEQSRITLPGDIEFVKSTAIQYGLKHAADSETGRGATVINKVPEFVNSERQSS